FCNLALGHSHSYGSVLPRDRVPKGLFKGLNFPFPVRKEVVRIVNNRRRSAEEDSRSAQRRLARLQRSNARLSKMGLKYQFQPELDMKACLHLT
ncbi:unnamed protein product, partial [Ixodes pacificus]